MNKVRVEYEAITPFGPSRGSVQVNDATEAEAVVRSLSLAYGPTLTSTSVAEDTGDERPEKEKK